MTLQDERASGTTDDPTPDDTDEAVGAVASEDPAADGSDSDNASGDEGEDELTKVRRENTRLLSERKSVKAAEAEAERLKRELDAVRGGTDAPTTDPSRAVEDTRARLGREARARFDKDMRLLAEMDDPAAGFVVTQDHVMAQGRVTRALAENARENARELAFQRELRKVPGALRDRVEELVRSGDVSSVKRAQDFAELEAERGNGKTKPHDDGENGEVVRAKIARREGEPEVSRRAVTRGEVRARTIKGSDYRAQLQAARQAGNSDRMQELIADRAAKKFVVVED